MQARMQQRADEYRQAGAPIPPLIEEAIAGLTVDNGQDQEMTGTQKIDAELAEQLALSRQQLRKTQEQIDKEAKEAEEEKNKKPGDKDREPIAVKLTEEQTKLLLSSEYPNDGRTQTTTLAAIYSGEDEVNIMDESVQLDYSEDEKTFFAILERGEKPALDAKLTQLQQDRMRDNAEQEKAQDPRQKERQRQRQYER
jgi:hypothetical protein